MGVVNIKIRGRTLAPPHNLVDPRHEPAHPLLVAGILGERVPQLAFFPAGLGIKERGQGQRRQQSGPASPNQRPANRAAEHCRAERMAHQPIDARLDQFGARAGRFPDLLGSGYPRDVTKLAEEGLAVGALGSAGGSPPGDECFGPLRRHEPQDRGRARLPASNPRRTVTQPELLSKSLGCPGATGVRRQAKRDAALAESGLSYLSADCCWLGSDVALRLPPQSKATFSTALSRSRDTGGAGLGLAIVKTCVGACQGPRTACRKVWRSRLF